MKPAATAGALVLCACAGQFAATIPPAGPEQILGGVMLPTCGQDCSVFVHIVYVREASTLADYESGGVSYSRTGQAVPAASWSPGDPLPPGR